MSASNWLSGSSTQIPTASIIATTLAVCSGVTVGPAARPATPLPTSAGVLGMTRITGCPSGSTSVSRARVTPAATETTTASGPRWGAMSVRAVATWWGLTATTTTSATLTPDTSTERTPRRSRSLARRSVSWSTATISSGEVPAAIQPAVSASPMAPAPMTAIIGPTAPRPGWR